MSYDPKEIELIYRIAGHLADGDTLDEELATVVEFAVTLTHAEECCTFVREGMCALEIMEDAGSLSHVPEPLGIAPSGRRYVRYLDRYMAQGSQPRWATTVDPTPKHA